MKDKYCFCLYVVLAISSITCNNQLQCERHYIPKGFIGKVTIFFNQKNGQQEFDKNGCIVYKINENGNCYTSLPFKEGTAIPNETLEFFEIIGTDSVNQIFEFYQKDYLKDTL